MNKHVKNRVRFDKKTCEKELKMMSWIELAEKYGYSKTGLRMALARIGVFSPRKSGNKIRKNK